MPEKHTPFVWKQNSVNKIFFVLTLWMKAPRSLCKIRSHFHVQFPQLVTWLYYLDAYTIVLTIGMTHLLAMSYYTRCIAWSTLGWLYLKLSGTLGPVSLRLIFKWKKTELKMKATLTVDNCNKRVDTR